MLLFDLASHLHKTVYELEHCMPPDELSEWVAWFELRDPNRKPAVQPESDYAAIRNVLN